MEIPMRLEMMILQEKILRKNRVCGYTVVIDMNYDVSPRNVQFLDTLHLWFA